MSESDGLRVGLTMSTLIQNTAHWRKTLDVYIQCAERDPKFQETLPVLHELLNSLTITEQDLRELNSKS